MAFALFLANTSPMSFIPIVTEAQAHVALEWRAAALFAAIFAAVALATRVRPAVGIAIMLALDPFAFYRYFDGTTITIPKVALLAVVAGLVLRNTPFDVLRARRIVPVVTVSGLLVAANALTWFSSSHHPETVRETLKAAEYFVALLIAIVACASDGDERMLYRGLMLGGIASIVLALAQDYTVAPSAIVLGGHLVPRIAGPLEGPNQLAGYLEIVLPTLLAVRLTRGANVVLDLVLLAGTFAAVLTFSRGGLGGLALGFLTVVFAFIRPDLIRRFVALIGASSGIFTILFAAAVVAGKVDTARLGPDAFSGLGTRTQLWRAALAMWRGHPLLGVGAGNFELEISDVGASGIRTHANSLYLQALAEGGIVLFGLTLAAFIVVANALLRYVRSPLALGALGATVALGVHQVFDDLFFFPKVGELWWLLVGAAIVVPMRLEHYDFPAD
jgi:O-antigen ligase